MKPSAVTAALAGALAIFWSSGFVGATLSTRSAPFDTVLVWRTGLCGLLVGAVVLVRRERLSVRQLRQQAGRGALVQGVYLGGTFAAAAAGVPAGVTALIAALQPLLVAGLARPMLGTAVGARQLVGLVVGAAGVAIVVAGNLGGTPAWAFALPVLAVAGLAVGTVLEGRDREPAPLLASFATQCAVATVLFGVVAGARGEFVPPADGSFWAAIAWLIGFSAFGGYGAYLLLVRRNGPTLASTLLYLTPPTTTLWAWAMFGQQPGLLALPGAVVTGVGIAIFATGRRTGRGIIGERAPARRIRRRSGAGRASPGRPGAVRPTPRPASRT